jgi:hypothetical protein
VYAERVRSPEFAFAWDDAAGEARDRVDELLWQWAHGVPVVKRTVRRDGSVVTIERSSVRWSPRAAVELLCRHRPEWRGALE